MSMERHPSRRTKKNIRTPAARSNSVATTRATPDGFSSNETLSPVVTSSSSGAISSTTAPWQSPPLPATPATINIPPQDCLSPNTSAAPSPGKSFHKCPFHSSILIIIDIDMPTAFPKFVELDPELQVKIIEFAWAELRELDRINEAHACDFELGRKGLLCPSAPSFNDFRRSFKSRKLLPLAQKAIFHRSTLLVHVDLVRENYSFLPVGYIPSILTTLNKVR